MHTLLIAELLVVCSMWSFGIMLHELFCGNIPFLEPICKNETELKRYLCGTWQSDSYSPGFQGFEIINRDTMKHMTDRQVNQFLGGTNDDHAVLEVRCVNRQLRQGLLKSTGKAEDYVDRIAHSLLQDWERCDIPVTARIGLARLLAPSPFRRYTATLMLTSFFEITESADNEDGEELSRIAQWQVDQQKQFESFEFKSQEWLPDWQCFSKTVANCLQEIKEDKNFLPSNFHSGNVVVAIKRFRLCAAQKAGDVERVAIAQHALEQAEVSGSNNNLIKSQPDVFNIANGVDSVPSRCCDPARMDGS